METTRDEILERSALGFDTLATPNNFKKFSVGRVKTLKSMGNPLFGGTPENMEEWPLERKVGTAWVLFQLEMDEIRCLLSNPNHMKIIDEKWEEDMHYTEVDSTYEWIMSQAGATAAARTEALEQPQGKE